jgi:hypothetical protein
MGQMNSLIFFMNTDAPGKAPDAPARDALQAA